MTDNPQVTVLTPDQAAELTRRREALSLECAASTPRCAGCDGIAAEGGGRCEHECHAVSEESPARTNSSRLLEIAAAASRAQAAQREVARLIREEAYERGLADGATAERERIAAAIRAQIPSVRPIEAGPDLLAWAAEIAECVRCQNGVCNAHRSVSQPGGTT